LWGDTNEEIWRPPSRKMIVVRHPAGLDHLPLETVFRHILELWATGKTVGK